MTANFSLAKKMDVDTLAQIVELRDRNGLHVDYPYGLRIGGPNDWDFPFPPPKYPGASIRIFIYNKVNSYAKVSMAKLENPASDHTAIEIKKTTVNITRKGDRKTLPDLTLATELGRFVSIGLRMDNFEIRPLFNKQVGIGAPSKIYTHEMNWSTKIYSGQNYIVSLHLCDEVGTNFPENGLNQRFGFGFVLPIGSRVTVFAVFVGGTKDGQRIWIGFQQDNGKYVGQSYPNVPMKINEEFCISASNSSDGWILATSFLGRNQNTAPLLRKNQEAHTDVQVSNNCYIRRILAVSAAIPHQYRYN